MRGSNLLFLSLLLKTFRTTNDPHAHGKILVRCHFRDTQVALNGFRVDSLLSCALLLLKK